MRPVQGSGNTPPGPVFSMVPRRNGILFKNAKITLNDDLRTAWYRLIRDQACKICCHVRFENANSFKQELTKQECIAVGYVPIAAVATTRC